MKLKRNLEKKVNDYLESFPVVAILGARQCGKTTLSRIVRGDWSYFDLERAEDYELITRDIGFFLQEHAESTIIDEAQSVPDLFKEMRGVVDRSRDQKGRYILTGSSSTELISGLSESLAGRVGIIELGTLKMNERYAIPLSPFYAILNDLPPEEHLDALRTVECPLSNKQVMRHFLYGGYPEPVQNDKSLFFDRWMTNYHKTYIERDIRTLFPQLNMQNYRRFITMLSNLSGTILNRSEVGRSLNIGESSVRNYLDIAEGTYIWRSIPSLECTVSKSVVKMARGYLRDSGLLHHLLRIRTLDRMYTNPGVGAGFEGFISEEIIQGLDAVSSVPWNANYYRTRNGAEVDLVLTSPDGDRIAVEIKFGALTRGNHLSGLKRFIEQEGLSYGIVVNNAEEVKMLAPRIIQIPAGAL